MSFISELEAVEADVVANSWRLLYVPDRGLKLAVRYKAPDDLDDPLLARIVGLASTNQGLSLSRDEQLQLLVICCDEILTRDTTQADLTPVAGPDGDGELGPLRFDAGDPRWEGKCKTARDCVSRLYRLDLKPLAAAGHALAVIDFLQGVAGVADQVVQTEGKEPGATSA